MAAVPPQPIEVVAGVGARSSGNLRGPGTVRRGGEYVFNANYGNNGDADGIAPLLLIRNLDNSPFSLSRDTLGTQSSAPGRVVQALGDQHDGRCRCPATGTAGQHSRVLPRRGERRCRRPVSDEHDYGG